MSTESSLAEAATETAVSEDALELLKIVNDDETGFAVRYISQCSELTRRPEGKEAALGF
jgi:hypothetical protein